MDFIAVENVNIKPTQRKLKRSVRYVPRFIGFVQLGGREENFAVRSAGTTLCVIMSQEFAESVRRNSIYQEAI